MDRELEMYDAWIHEGPQFHLQETREAIERIIRRKGEGRESGKESPKNPS